MPDPSESLLDSDVTFTTPPFSSLDPRLLKALADLKFAHPTLVQTKAIPLLLEGKDVMARARTGSGKTGAYAIPAVQRVLETKGRLDFGSSEFDATRILVLVPTRELSIQVTSFFNSLLKYCEDLVKVINVASGNTNSQRLMLSDKPDILISTPSRLLTLLQSKAISLEHLSLLAIDEADLLLSYGHKEDLEKIMNPISGYMPKLGVQGCLVSATLSEDMESVKGLILRNPAVLTLSEPTATSLLTQHYTLTSEKDKFLLLYVLLKLKLIRGKSIVFVNDIDRGYRLKLFLGQFGIKVCVVNAELPLASRYHVVEEFNRGVYDVVVATDEGAAGMEDLKPPQKAEEEESKDVETEELGEKVQDEESELKEEELEAGPSKKRSLPQPTNKRKRTKGDGSSLARGIDFTNASSVINFDLPTSSTAYMHRVGRTARAGHSGLALSFIVPQDKYGKDKAVSIVTAKDDEDVWKRICKRVKDSEEYGGGEMKEWDWGGRKKEIEGFRYRMEDALRAVTTKRIQEARREEVKKELLNSEKLKAHFAANPLDLAYLRHDTITRPVRQQSHLKHVPTYLMPKIAAPALNNGDVGENGHIGFHKSGGRGRGRGRGRGGMRGGPGRKAADPLKLKKR